MRAHTCTCAFCMFSREGATSACSAYTACASLIYMWCDCGPGLLAPGQAPSPELCPHPRTSPVWRVSPKTWSSLF